MLSYGLKCKKKKKKKKTQSNGPVMAKTSNGKKMMLSRCDICGSKK